MITIVSVAANVSLAFSGASDAMADQINASFSFSRSDLSFVDDGSFVRVQLADGAWMPDDKIGSPEIPAKTVNIMIPAGARVDGIDVKGQESLIKLGAILLPVQPPICPSLPAPAFVAPDAQAYSENNIRPKMLAEMIRPHEMRGSTFVSVRLNPVRYIAAKKELYFATNINVTINYSLPEKPVRIHKRNKNYFNEMMKSLVVNPQNMDEFAPLTTTATDETSSPHATANASVKSVESQAKETDCDYLVITDSALTNSFQALANLRQSKGLASSVITLQTIYASYDGEDNQSKIRNCIKDYVATKGAMYVVLGGDDTIVPVRACYVETALATETNMPTDLYDAGLDGNGEADGNGI